jgi:hypothetical protein
MLYLKLLYNDRYNNYLSANSNNISRHESSFQI